MRSNVSLGITTYSRLVSGSITWTGAVSAVCSWSLVSSMLMAVSFPASYPFSHLSAISSTLRRRVARPGFAFPDPGLVTGREVHPRSDEINRSVGRLGQRHVTLHRGFHLAGMRPG